ncbi:hypothetical protein MMYC01_208524 [Madurella mycetomatis]|uniref:Uncharacterized protein n=1 Tax=Madurella mycetomatis TaxID=100816 RepID=A0A175VSZ6_9PEZI|nr:hypothetical protein MMYC01_208524 [Madurella mycetomatis]
MRGPRGILLLILSFSGLCWAQQRCFYPNGEEAVFPNGARAPTNFPCDPDAEDSACCGGEVGMACLTNKLCRGPDGNTIRGSCTDRNWNSLDCPQFCLGAREGGTDLISCANVTGTDTSYCCDGHRAFCCDEGVARFEVFPSSPEVFATFDAEVSQFVVIQRTTSSSALSTPTTTTTSAAALTSTSQSSNPTPDSSAQTQPAPPALSTGAQAGIGVGAGILAVALAVVAFLLLKLRKKNAQLAEMEKAQEAQQYGGPGPMHNPTEYKADIPWYQYPLGRTGLTAVQSQEMDGQGAAAELASTPNEMAYR